MVIAGDDLLDGLARLKQVDGGDILTWGTGRLTDALAGAGPLDEYRICTARRPPEVAGSRGCSDRPLLPSLTYVHACTCMQAVEMRSRGT